MLYNPFDREEVLQPWFEGDEGYVELKSRTLDQYLRSCGLQPSSVTTARSRSNYFLALKALLASIFTKKVLVLVMVVLLALGGVSAVAAELLAPMPYKPSSLVRLVGINTFEDCQQVGGLVHTQTEPVICEYYGRFFEKAPERPTNEVVTAGKYAGWRQFTSAEHGFEIKHPANFIPKSGGGDGKAYKDVVVLVYNGTNVPGSGLAGESIFVGVKLDAGGSLVETAKQEFEESKIYCQNLDPKLCQAEMIYNIKAVSGGELLIITNPNPTSNSTAYNLILAKPTNGNSVFKLVVADNFPELPDMLSSISFSDPKPVFGEPNGFSVVPPQPGSILSTKTYTNPAYPNFAIRYPGSWELKVVNDSKGSGLLNALRFTKGSLTLTYQIDNLTYFEDGPWAKCTNNQNLFLEIGGNFARIRDNDGSRYYTRYLKRDVERVSASETAAKYQDSFQQWVNPAPTGRYKACHINDKSFVMKSRVKGDQNPGESEYYHGLVNIKLTGVNSASSADVKEADQIVVSTTFDDMFSDPFGGG